MTKDRVMQFIDVTMHADSRAREEDTQTPRHSDTHDETLFPTEPFDNLSF